VSPVRIDPARGSAMGVGRPSNVPPRMPRPRHRMRIYSVSGPRHLISRPPVESAIAVRSSGAISRTRYSMASSSIRIDIEGPRTFSSNSADITAARGP
jgi:hypothetical protein